MAQRGVTIIKADGEKELFSGEKLLDSLTRAGATAEVARQIVAHIEREVRDGMSTHDIYKHAFYLLHKTERPLALRYSLKRSVMEFGPSGFPFERFIGEIWRRKGYSIELDKIVQGNCTEHEVDVIAYDDKKLTMMEVKFHNQYGVKSDLKVVLYVKARMDDLMEATFMYGDKERKLDEGILVTNTKFTNTAIKYAECRGLRIIGWNYPAKGNLEDLIEESGLHPLTCLTSLTVTEKKNLMNNNIVLCNSLRDDQSILRSMGFQDERIQKVMEETAMLCPVI
jgi:hypothetical protein